MENKEDILDALNLFEKKPASDIPPLLEEYLSLVARTGETLFPWPKLKPLFMKKLDKTMCKFFEEIPTDNLPPYPNVENIKFEDMRKRIMESVDVFTGVPFTIQRLCELVTNPKKHYKRTDKFLRGIEKNVIVVSTVDPFGRKVINESKPMINGLEISPNNSYQESGAYNTNPSSPFVPPSWYAQSTAPPPNWNVKVDTTKVTNENGVQGNGDASDDHKKDVEEENDEKTSASEAQHEEMPTAQSSDSSNSSNMEDKSSDDSGSSTSSSDEDQKLVPDTENVVSEPVDTDSTLDLEAKETVQPEPEQQSKGADLRSIEINTDMTMAATDDASSSSSSGEVNVDVPSGSEGKSEVQDSSSGADDAEESHTVIQSQEDVISTSVESEPIAAAAAAVDIGEPPVLQSGKHAKEEDLDEGPPRKKLRENSPLPESSTEEQNMETKEQLDQELELPAEDAGKNVSDNSEICAKEKMEETSEVCVEPGEAMESETEVVETTTQEIDQVVDNKMDNESDAIETATGSDVVESTSISETEQIVTEKQAMPLSESVDTVAAPETLAAESKDAPEDVSPSDIEPSAADSMETASTDNSGISEADSNTDSTVAKQEPEVAAGEDATSSVEQETEQCTEESMDQD